MTTTQAIPPPYSGQNDQYPLIAIQNPNCRYMHNFNNLEGVVKLRKGNDKFCEVTAGAPLQPLNIATYNDKLFILVDPAGAGVLTWYDITSGTPSSVHTAGAGGDDEINTLYFNGYLFYFGEFSLTTPEYYNGSAWGTSGYTFPGGFRPFGGDVYKHRAYMLGYGSARYVYTGIDAITGATTLVDLGGIISEPANLYIIRPISLTQNITPEAVQAFILSSGEVLVYQGSWPDAPDWSLVSRFTVSKIPYLHFFVDAKGDSFLMTESEILSLRNLYTSGYDYEKQNGIGRAIKNRWTAIIKAFGGATTLIHGIYDKRKDRIIISLPLWLDPDTNNLYNYPSQLIYDFTLGAWYEYYQVTGDAGGTGATETASVAYFDGSTYILVLELVNHKAVVLKIDYNLTYIDQDPRDAATTSIHYQIQTAPLPMQKFGANAINGVEVICKTDLYPQTNYKFIADLGRQTTSSQSLPSQGTSISKPMMNVGIQGAITTQLDISGDSISCSLGLELYAFNIWYTAGDKGSR